MRVETRCATRRSCAGDGELGELLDDVFRRPEEDARVGLGQHRGVVVGVPGCDDAEVQLVEGLDGLPLLVLLAQVVVRDPSALVDLQPVTEEGGPAELSHQRSRELVEGVGENHHLQLAPEPVEEFPGPGER